MMYEFRVSEMAEEFGVHRNTIRNWINAGTLPAKEGPGKKYLIKYEDYRALCEKFGREPLIKPSSYVDLDKVQRYEASKDMVQPLDLDYKEKTIYSDAVRLQGLTGLIREKLSGWLFWAWRRSWIRRTGHGSAPCVPNARMPVRPGFRSWL